MYKVIYHLPTKLKVGDQLLEIRSDFRPILDICTALSDPDLTDNEKATIVLMVLYPQYEKISNADEALNEALKFINHGEMDESTQKPPKLMDWAQDFKVISPGIDKVLGFSCRRCDYLHWWEFLGAYYEIGEGMFSTIIAIRSKLAKGKKLENFEKELLANNFGLVRLTPKLTQEETDFLTNLGVN